MKSVFLRSICKIFLSILRTNPGMASTFAKERKRSWRGKAMNRDTASRAKSAHHFSHQDGMEIVIKTDVPASNIIRMERGMSACWIVLSMKLILP